MFSTKDLRLIFDRTSGHCHFCGDILQFEKYGLKTIDQLGGVWEADHVFQKGRGGDKNVSNCLAACYRCNHLRWHRSGSELRELIFLGIIAKNQIRKNSETGQILKNLVVKKEVENTQRRRKVYSS